MKRAKQSSLEASATAECSMRPADVACSVLRQAIDIVTPDFSLADCHAVMNMAHHLIAVVESVRTCKVSPIALLTMDWALQLFLGYSTEPTPRDSLEQHLVLLLPYSAILRPVVLVLRSDSLRDGASPRPLLRGRDADR